MSTIETRGAESVNGYNKLASDFEQVGMVTGETGDFTQNALLRVLSVIGIYQQLRTEAAD